MRYETRRSGRVYVATSDGSVALAESLIPPRRCFCLLIPVILLIVRACMGADMRVGPSYADTLYMARGHLPAVKGRC